MPTEPLMPIRTPATPRLVKTSLSDRFIVVKGRARWDIDEDIRAFEASTIQRVLATLVDAAERESQTETVRWLKKRVVAGQTWDMLKSSKEAAP